MFIKVKVTTDAKREKIVKKTTPTSKVGAPTKSVGDYSFIISVKEPAERNLANKKVLELVREYFKVYNGSIKIVSGHHSPSKIININNI